MRHQEFVRVDVDTEDVGYGGKILDLSVDGVRVDRVEQVLCILRDFGQIEIGIGYALIEVLYLSFQRAMQGGPPHVANVGCDIFGDAAIN